MRADTGPGGKGRRKETRTFRSFTGELEAMADWFTAEGVTEVVMEATGSYWKPVWYVLEERAFELKLVNAQHVKILPGRKSDVLDAEWLAGRGRWKCERSVRKSVRVAHTSRPSHPSW